MAYLQLAGSKARGLSFGLDYDPVTLQVLGVRLVGKKSGCRIFAKAGGWAFNNVDCETKGDTRLVDTSRGLPAQRIFMRRDLEGVISPPANFPHRVSMEP